LPALLSASVLETGDISLDAENGHEHAYQKIFAASEKYEECPRFFTADSQDFGDHYIAANGEKWMNMAEQVSVGGRKQVLEDGADVCNSESDSDHKDRGDELIGAYVGMELDSQGRPVNQDHKLTPEQASAQRARAAKATESTPPPQV
jgi:hypothetical protein